MNDHDKFQDAAQQSEYARDVARLLNLLEAVDRQITPEHVAQRFHELLEDIGDDGPRVPVAPIDRMIVMRDSKNSEDPILTCTPAEWRAFMQRVLQGEFDEFGYFGVASESFLEGERGPSASPSSSAEPAFPLRAVLREAARARADARRCVEDAHRCAEELQDTALDKAARIEAEARDKAARIEAEARDKAERTLDEAHQAAARIQAAARVEAEEIKTTARNHADGPRKDLLSFLLSGEKIFSDGAPPALPNAGRHVLKVAFNSSKIEQVMEQTVAAWDADRFSAWVRSASSYRLLASCINEVLGRRLATLADVSSFEGAERSIAALSARCGSRAWRRYSRHQERIDETPWSMQTSFYPRASVGRSWAQLWARELADRSDFGCDPVEFVHHSAPWHTEVRPDQPTDLVLVGTAGQTVLVELKHQLREGGSPWTDVSRIRDLLAARVHEQGAAVLLIAPAGTGKTRLVAALADALTSPAFALKVPAEEPLSGACLQESSPSTGIADVVRSISYVVDPLGVCATSAYETPATVRHSEDPFDVEEGDFMIPARRPTGQQATALVSLSTCGAMAGFTFTHGTVDDIPGKNLPVTGTAQGDAPVSSRHKVPTTGEDHASCHLETARDDTLPE